MKKLVQFCERKWKVKHDPYEQSMGVEESTALIYNMNLSQRQYQYLSQSLLTKNLSIDTRKHVLAFKTTLHPPLIVEPLKCSVSFLDLLRSTTTSIIDTIDKPIDLDAGQLLLLESLV